MVEYDHSLINDLIHSKLRLTVMAILAAADWAEFTYLRDMTKTTDGNLSIQLSKLEQAGYVKRTLRLVEKKKKAVSDYSITPKGRDAFEAYVGHLSSLLERRRPMEEK